MIIPVSAGGSLASAENLPPGTGSLPPGTGSLPPGTGSLAGTCTVLAWTAR